MTRMRLSMQAVATTCKAWFTDNCASARVVGVSRKRDKMGTE